MHTYRVTGASREDQKTKVLETEKDKAQEHRLSDAQINFIGNATFRSCDLLQVVFLQCYSVGWVGDNVSIPVLHKKDCIPYIPLYSLNGSQV